MLFRKLDKFLIYYVMFFQNTSNVVEEFPGLQKRRPKLTFSRLQHSFVQLIKNILFFYSKFY